MVGERCTGKNTDRKIYKPVCELKDRVHMNDREREEKMTG